MSITRSTTLAVSEDGTRYRDLNGNGVMDPYEDPRRPVEERVADLLGRLSLAEKAGLMFHAITPVPMTGSLADDAPPPGRPSARELVGTRLVTHLNLHRIPEPRLMARWVNEMQAMAEASPHGIPLTFSTDPRHSFIENFGASFTAEHFSAWPEPIGLGALADEDTVREFGRIARVEYTAQGIRSALHPTVDLATEPRWARQYSTFGQAADTAARLAIAYLDGFEGPELGADSVACMAKHFPGGGPQKDGEDPHFPYGREQVYPGDRFAYHLEPFRRVLERGVSAVMPYYGMPVGLTLDGEPVEEVGFGFNRRIIQGLLRDELGYDGVVCTDWSLVTESRFGDRALPARAWGVEHLSVEERVLKVIEAGCDQFGGEECPEVVVGLVERGLLDERRLDESVRRLLAVKFRLGLFDDPFVDEDRLDELVGTPENRAAGELAQARSVTVLKNGTGSPLLPLAPGTVVHSAEIGPDELEAAGLVAAASPADAEVVVVRLDAPYEPRDTYFLESSFHAGSLDLAPATVERVRHLAEGAPVVAVVHLDRPAVLTGIEPACEAIAAVYGASDRAVLRTLTGEVRPDGRLPFDLPRSMAAVEASRPDVPGDSADPLYPAGAGLTWPTPSAPTDPNPPHSA